MVSSRTASAGWRRVCIGVAMIALGGFTGTTLADDSLRQETAAALRKAVRCFRSLATEGGYAGIYTLDLSQRYGEGLYETVGRDKIWVQRPGTPSVGEAYLRAHRATGDATYLTAATDVGRALVWAQRQAGGWDHQGNVGALRSGSQKPRRTMGACTFDDNITQGALTYLMALGQIVDEAWLDDGVALALRFMRDSQAENGAWPQWHPTKWYNGFIGGYQGHYTFNDNAINDCIRAMLKAYELYEDEAYLQSAQRGGDFIILSQRPSPQAGWAQQYSHDLKPARARPFEPAAVCSAVTGRNIKTLVDLYLVTQDAKYLAPIPAAVHWLEESQLQKNVWARLYELKTNRPIYADKKGKIYYDLEELSQERRLGYGWQGGFTIPAALAYYEQVKGTTIEAYRTRSSVGATTDQRRRRAEQLTGRLRQVIAALDEEGRWIRNDMIHCSDFVKHINVLIEYLELTTD